MGGSGFGREKRVGLVCGQKRHCHHFGAGYPHNNKSELERVATGSHHPVPPSLPQGEFKFAMPGTTSPLELTLYIVSDSYLGGDVEINFKLKSSAKRIVKVKKEAVIEEADTEDEVSSDDDDF